MGIIACAIFLTTIVFREQGTQKSDKRGKRSRSRKPRKYKTVPRRRVTSTVIVLTLMTLLMSVYVVYYMITISGSTQFARRNFYGVLRIWEINTEVPALSANQLTHGKTVHGFQFHADQIRYLPTTYYSEDSGVGLVFANHPSRPGNLNVGALGLGIGVIAYYGEPGDIIRFYEINPDVIHVAEGEGGYFDFLESSNAEIQIVSGDGRIALESELISSGSQNFDLLVLDAFSGDTIPLHLLTKEAFEIYLEHMSQNGIIAINASNRYFDLVQTIYKLADSFNLNPVLIENRGDGIRSYDSVWVLLTYNQEFLNQTKIAERSAPHPFISPNLAVWTDDFSNLIQILK